MEIIDAHQHFWNYDAVRHSWITDEMSVIKKNFLPVDLEPVFTLNGIAGCVAVQAEQSEKETDFLIHLARENDFIKAVVGWIDLLNENIEKRLEYYMQFGAVKGFRHVLQGEEPEFMLQPAFERGIESLGKFDMTYDILVFPKHLKAVLKLVREFPNQLFVVDHIAKPFIKDQLIDDWKKDMQAIAECENVYCKISGMVTEANWQQWKQDDFAPYLDTVTEAFGIKRIMFGSDWPVCLVAGSYQRVLTIVKEYFSSFTKNEQELFFGKNAIQFYHLF